MAKYIGTKQDRQMRKDRKHEQHNPVVVLPYKNHQGNFFVVRLRSISRPSTYSQTAIPVEGHELQLEDSIRQVVGLLCEYQQDTFGDCHRVSERQADGVEAFRKLLADFRDLAKGR